MTGSAVLDSLKNNSSSRRWYGPHLAKEFISNWEITRIIRDAQRVVVQKVDKPGEFMGFRPLHRHQKKYMNKQRNRIAKLQDYKQPARYLVTFTVDPKRFRNDREAYAGLMDGWNKVYHRLKRRSDRLQVLRVVEVQKNAQPHLHVLLWGVHLPRGWAAEVYKVCSGYVDVSPIRHGNRGAVSYLGKYLTKMNALVLAGLTRWKARTLSVSGKQMRESLGPLIDEKSTGKWELFDFFHCRQDVEACEAFTADFAQELYEDPTGPP